MKIIVTRVALLLMSMLLVPTSLQSAARSSLSLQTTPDRKRPRSPESAPDERSSLAPSSTEGELKEQAGDAQRPPLHEAGSLDSDDEEEQELKRGVKKQRTREPQRWPAVAATSSSSSPMAQQGSVVTLDTLIKRKRALLPNAIRSTDAWWGSHGSVGLTAEKAKEETEKQLAELTHDIQKLDALIKAFTAHDPNQDNKDAAAKLVVSPEEIKQLNQDIMVYFSRAPLALQYKKAQERIIGDGKKAFDKLVLYLADRTLSSDEQQKMVDAIIEDVVAQLAKLTDESTYKELALLPASVSPVIDNERIKAILLTYRANSVPLQAQLAESPDDPQKEVESALRDDFAWLTYFFGMNSQSIHIMEPQDVVELQFSEDGLIFLDSSEESPSQRQVYIYDQDATRLKKIFSFAQIDRCRITFNGSAIVQSCPDGRITVFKRNDKEYRTIEVAKADEERAKVAAAEPMYTALSTDGNRLLVYYGSLKICTVFIYNNGVYKPFFSTTFEDSQHIIMSGDGYTILCRNDHGATLYRYNGKAYKQIPTSFDASLATTATRRVSINLDGSLIFCADETVLTIYARTESSTTTYEPVQKVPCLGRTFEKSNDGSFFYSFSENKSKIYKLLADKRFHAVAVPGVKNNFNMKAFSPNGSLLAIRDERSDALSLLFYNTYAQSYIKFNKLNFDIRDGDVYISDHPQLCFCLSTRDDEEGTSDALKLFKPLVDEKSYAQLPEPQQTLLKNIYITYSTRKLPEAINLNEEQSVFWRGIPEYLKVGLVLTNPSLIVRALPSPEEAAVIRDMKMMLDLQEKKLIDIILKDTPKEEQLESIKNIQRHLSGIRLFLNPSVIPLARKLKALLENDLSHDSDTTSSNKTFAAAVNEFRETYHTFLKNALTHLALHNTVRSETEEKTEKEEKDNKSQSEQKQEESV